MARESQFRQTALDIAARIAREAMRAALNGDSGQAARSYMTEDGPLICRATYDGESVVTEWRIEGGAAICRAAAETKIEARLVARIGRA